MTINVNNGIQDNIDFLNEKIELINSNVQFNISIMWTIIAIMLASVAVALYYLIKQWVNDKVEKELKNKLENVKIDLRNELSEFCSSNFQTIKLEVKDVVEQAKYLKVARGSNSKASNSGSIDISGLSIINTVNPKIVYFEIRDLYNGKALNFTYDIKSKDNNFGVSVIINDENYKAYEWFIAWIDF